jgi:hypothetical protein
VEKLLHVISVAHKRLPELRVFVQSWINQTSKDWSMTIIHDGPCQDFIDLMSETNYRHPSVKYFCTESRHNDFGHSLRDEGLKQATGLYTILTNADNYFIPKTVEFISTKLAELQNNKIAPPDVIIFDMVHSHSNPGGHKQPPYNYFKVDFKPYCIDVSSAAVKTELAKSAGFKDKSHDGDQTYFQDIAKLNGRLTVAKINSVLLVHN